MENFRFKDARVDRVFTNAEDANDYYDYLVKMGYSTNDINVIMSEGTKNKFYATKNFKNETAGSPKLHRLPRRFDGF